LQLSLQSAIRPHTFVIRLVSRRLALSILIGIAAALVCWLRILADGSHFAFDLSWPLRGAVELLAGHNP